MAKPKIALPPLPQSSQDSMLTDEQKRELEVDGTMGHLHTLLENRFGAASLELYRRMRIMETLFMSGQPNPPTPVETRNYYTKALLP